MVNVDNYPMTYCGLLTDEQKNEILATAARFKKTDTKIYLNYVNQLEQLGIMVEYNWHGHRGELFLATYQDAIYEEDCLFENL